MKLQSAKKFLVLIITIYFTSLNVLGQGVSTWIPLPIQVENSYLPGNLLVEISHLPFASKKIPFQARPGSSEEVLNKLIASLRQEDE